jgi:hypothetical protein
MRARSSNGGLVAIQMELLHEHGDWRRMGKSQEEAPRPG